MRNCIRIAAALSTRGIEFKREILVSNRAVVGWFKISLSRWVYYKKIRAFIDVAQYAEVLLFKKFIIRNRSVIKYPQLIEIDRVVIASARRI